MRVTARIIAITMTTSLLCATAAQAQGFPGKPVRIVPFGTAGGPVDILARLYAEKLRERWKQPVIVEAKPGASGTLAADFVAKAPPDGTTFLITLSLTHINNAILQKTIPYDPFRDFAPLSQLAVGYGPALIAPAFAVYAVMRLRQTSVTKRDLLGVAALSNEPTLPAKSASFGSAAFNRSSS